MSRVALFDLDGTLADYHGQLIEDFKRIASPYEPEIDDSLQFNFPDYLEERRHIITQQAGWFKNLKKFQLGFDVLEACMDMGFEISILTKGPSRKFNAWSEKVEWCKNNLPENINGVTVTHDKSLVYGKVLVDDYPEYLLGWLEHRPRGLGIMPAHKFNENFKHPNVVRYDGTNIQEVKARLFKVSGMTLDELMGGKPTEDDGLFGYNTYTAGMCLKPAPHPLDGIEKEYSR